MNNDEFMQSFAEVYVVMCLKKSHPVGLLGREVDLKLDWADGMCGVLPIFTSRELAEKYAGGRYEILTASICREEEGDGG